METGNSVEFIKVFFYFTLNISCNCRATAKNLHTLFIQRDIALKPLHFELFFKYAVWAWRETVFLLCQLDLKRSVVWWPMRSTHYILSDLLIVSLVGRLRRVLRSRVSFVSNSFRTQSVYLLCKIRTSTYSHINYTVRGTRKLH